MARRRQLALPRQRWGPNVLAWSSDRAGPARPITQFSQARYSVKEPCTEIDATGPAAQALESAATVSSLVAVSENPLAFANDPLATLPPE